ncbi:hypothetical protein [Microbacterium sp.]|uniref:hypothetical protein n=1 Tax=Microbacterium sp. TaxID=51671 RepID=UPI003A8CC218
MTAGRVAGEARAATANVTAAMASDSYPIWWRGIDVPPPAAWTYMFESFTGDDTGDEWALAAAIFIAQTRRRTRLGPTFAELFIHLMPERNGLPAPFTGEMEFIERRRAIAAFRGHVTIDWRCRGLISFDKGVTRSLRVGRVFRELSRRRQVARLAGAPSPGNRMSDAVATNREERETRTQATRRAQTTES